jgi:hypothetical protein
MTHSRSLRIKLKQGTFAVVSLPSSSALPEWALSSTPFSVTRTDDELSCVCHESKVPAGVKAERGWRMLHVDEIIPFSAVGILASIVQPLAAARIPVFAFSTYNTDYVLVKEDQIELAVATLLKDHHTVIKEET